MVNLACTVETSTTAAEPWGALILGLIVVQNAAAKPVVSAGIPEMVVANDSSQHFFPPRRSKAEIDAVVARPPSRLHFIVSSSLVSTAICLVDCSKVFSGRFVALDRHLPTTIS